MRATKNSVYKLETIAHGVQRSMIHLRFQTENGIGFHVISEVQQLLTIL